MGNYLFQKSIRRARRKYGIRGHSITQNHDYGELNILPIAVAEDNYSYLVVDKTCMKGILIDPSDPDVIVVRTVLFIYFFFFVQKSFSLQSMNVV